MNRYLLTLMAFVLFGAAAAFAQPRLEIVGGNTYNWGNVPRGDDSLTARIELRNAGDKELKIDTVRPSCSCTAAPLDKKNLKPGESTYMNVTLNVKGKSGNIQKNITLTTNDPKKPNTYLTLKTKIVVPIANNPQYFQFPKLVVGQPARSTMDLHNTTGDIVILVDVATDKNTSVDLDTPVSLMPDEKLSVNATVTPRKAGYFNTRITIKTSHPDQASFDLKGYGKAEEALAEKAGAQE